MIIVDLWSPLDRDKPVAVATFTKFADGRVEVDRFPVELHVSEEFLRQSDPDRISRVGWRSFFIRCDNAVAIYRLEGKGPYPRSFLCRRTAHGVP